MTASCSAPAAVARAGASEKEREYAFDDDDFERVRKLIYSHAGISLSAQKRDMVYSRVTRRLRATGCATFKSYLALLDRSGEDEWQAFTNALTTNLTAFFRENHHFPVLEAHLRQLAERRQTTRVPITVWCSAASTGEEPYSLAMTAAEAFGTLTPPVRILATDIDTSVLEQADRGVYTRERVEKLEKKRLDRFFLRGTGANDGHVKIRPELRALVSFRPLNLLHQDWALKNAFDAIFCRNVLIYFDKPTQATMLERFAPLLRDDGLLFVGHSESLHHVSHLFRLQGNTVYGHAPPGRARSAP